MTPRDPQAQPAGEVAHQPMGPTPTCPRCGYDVSGPIATWHDACPIEGKCTECGLDFRWIDVLQPDRKRLPWLFEHATPRWRHLWLLRALLSTAIRSLNPFTFWQRVEMAHRISIWRLFLYIALCAVLMHTTLAVCRFGPVYLAVPEALRWRQESQRLSDRYAALDLESLPSPPPNELGVWMRDGWGGDGWWPLWNVGRGSAPAWAEGVGGAAPIGFFFQCEVPQELGWAEPRRSETFGQRPDLSGVWVSTYDEYMANRPGLLELLVDYSPIDRGEATIMVLWPYTAEWPVFGGSVWWGRRYYGWDNGWIDQSVLFAPPVLIPLAATLILPLTFITLTASLGKAGVRAAHFLRALAYSLGGLMIAHALAALAMGITLLIPLTIGGAAQEWASSLSRTLDDGVWFTAHLATAVTWLFLFWWMFCRRYLRLPHAFWVALLLSALAYMVVGVAGFTLAETFVPDVLREQLLNW